MNTMTESHPYFERPHGIFGRDQGAFQRPGWRFYLYWSGAWSILGLYRWEDQLRVAFWGGRPFMNCVRGLYVAA